MLSDESRHDVDPVRSAARRRAVLGVVVAAVCVAAPLASPTLREMGGYLGRVPMSAVLGPVLCWLAVVIGGRRYWGVGRAAAVAAVIVVVAVVVCLGAAVVAVGSAQMDDGSVLVILALVFVVPPASVLLPGLLALAAVPPRRALRDPAPSVDRSDESLA